MPFDAVFVLCEVPSELNSVRSMDVISEDMVGEVLFGLNSVVPLVVNSEGGTAVLSTVGTSDVGSVVRADVLSLVTSLVVVSVVTSVVGVAVVATAVVDSAFGLSISGVVTSAVVFTEVNSSVVGMDVACVLSTVLPSVDDSIGFVVVSSVVGFPEDAIVVSSDVDSDVNIVL